MTSSGRKFALTVSGGYINTSTWLRGLVGAAILLTIPVNVDFITMPLKPPLNRCWNGKAMVHLKPGVNPHNIQPEVNLLIQIVSSVYAKHGYDCEVTRLFDYTPLQIVTSLHNRDGICRAADFGTVRLPEVIRDIIFGEVKEAIGYTSDKPRAFDFVFEPRIVGPDGVLKKEQHFHGEFDSKFPAPLPQQV